MVSASLRVESSRILVIIIIGMTILVIMMTWSPVRNLLGGAGDRFFVLSDSILNCLGTNSGTLTRGGSGGAAPSGKGPDLLMIC